MIRDYFSQYCLQSMQYSETSHFRQCFDESFLTWISVLKIWVPLHQERFEMMCRKCITVIKYVNVLSNDLGKLYNT
jgi:hypothetical protein